MRGVYVLGVVVTLATAPLFAETPTNSYPFRYSTLDRSGALSLRPTSEATGLSFTLNAETFDKAIGLDAAGGPASETVTEWRPVAFVPPEVTVTKVAVAIPGSDAPAFITVTPSVEEGETATSVQFDLDTDATATETVSLVGADGIAHTATLRTYENATGVPLTPDKACAFSFADTQTGTAIRNFYTIDGAPHLRLSGSATVTRHTLTISNGETHTFSALAGFDKSMDRADQVFVVEFSDAGGTLQMNAPLQHAPLVIGSSVSSTEASTEAATEASTKAAVSFDSDFTVPLSLRDGEGGKGGLSLTFGEGASFNPSALLLVARHARRPHPRGPHLPPGARQPGGLRGQPAEPFLRRRHQPPGARLRRGLPGRQPVGHSLEVSDHVVHAVRYPCL